jgi:hypothetical protein
MTIVRSTMAATCKKITRLEALIVTSGCSTFPSQATRLIHIPVLNEGMELIQGDLSETMTIPYSSIKKSPATIPHIHANETKPKEGVLHIISLPLHISRCPPQTQPYQYIYYQCVPLLAPSPLRCTQGGGAAMHASPCTPLRACECIHCPMHGKSHNLPPPVQWSALQPHPQYNVCTHML